MSMETIGVIGAGQMGAGIAQTASANGFKVLLSDSSCEIAAKGKEKIESSLSKLVKKEKIQVVKKGKVRRAKLYFMRERRGKRARMTEEHVFEEDVVPEPPKEEKAEEARMVEGFIETTMENLETAVFERARLKYENICIKNVTKNRKP
mgnify:CR=1 FL=1